MALTARESLPGRRRDAMLRRIIDAYSAARSFGSRSETLSARLRELWTSPEWRRLREADKSYLHGYERCLSETLWRSLRMQHYSAVDHSWHDAFGPASASGSEWSRLYGGQCRPSEAGHIDRADTEAYGIGSYAASNSGLPTRYLWPESGPGEPPRYHYRPETPESLRVRVYTGDSVVEREWRPS